MVELYDTHEQGEIVKNWLRENGSAIVMGLVLAFGSLFGFKQWQLWEKNQHQQASAEYELLVDFLTENNLDAAVANYRSLVDDFPSSPYTPMASLRMARARIESGQFELAIALYQHAIDNAEPLPVRHIARERLARLQLDMGDSAAAANTLEGVAGVEGFEAQYAEIHGDILLADGKTEEAAVAYQEALELLDTGVGSRHFLEMKLEALGVNPDTPESES
jgi:predicted negative regulator of RcsB-dependent stress response